jgi:hypothetical protein
LEQASMLRQKYMMRTALLFVTLLLKIMSGIKWQSAKLIHNLTWKAFESKNAAVKIPRLPYGSLLPRTYISLFLHGGRVHSFVLVIKMER